LQKIIRRWIYLSGIALVLILPFVVTSNYMLGIFNLGLIMVVATVGLNISKGTLVYLMQPMRGFGDLGVCCGFIGYKAGLAV